MKTTTARWTRVKAGDSPAAALALAFKPEPTPMPTTTSEPPPKPESMLTVPMTVNKIFTAIGFSIALMAPATAAEIKFIGTDIISVSGRIEPGDHFTISPIVLRNMPDSTTIILNSQGGFGKAAFAIGRNIRARGLATKIPAGARCDSACSFLWLAGVRRKIDAMLDLTGIMQIEWA